MNDQVRANIIRRGVGDLAARLRSRLALTGDDAHTVVDRLDARFVDELHATACERLGVKADAANNGGGHPWAKRGGARNTKSF